MIMQSGFFYKDLEQVGVLLLVQKSVGYCRRCVVSVILCSGSEKRTEYYGAAEPPVRCGESHLSGLTEPLRSL